MLRKLLRLLCRHNYRYIGYKFLRYKGNTPVIDATYRCNKCGNIKKIKIEGRLEDCLK
jgi:hypothetical protein